MPMSISLIVPPGAGVERPSLGLELLQAAVGARGHAARIRYANLQFAATIGLDAYLALLAPHPSTCVMDWLFSRKAFQSEVSSPEAFHAKLQRHDRREAARIDCDFLAETRDLAEAFIDALADDLFDDAPQVIGCTSMFGQHCAALAILRAIKHRAPHIVTLLGGANCDGAMGIAAHRLFPWVDYVIVGEGEEVLPGLLDVLDRGPAQRLDGVLTPTHRRTGYPTGNRARATVADLAGSPSPVFDDYLSQHAETPFSDRVTPGLLLETSRGCWWGERVHCKFCGLNGAAMTYRQLGPERVVDRMDELVDRHGITRIEVVDNILSADHVEPVFQALLERPRDLNLFYEVKSNLTRRQLDLMSRAGVRWIQPGIESLSTTTLRLMGKGAAAWQNVVFLKHCRQLGISVEWNFIFGTPGESDASFEAQAHLIPLIEHLQPGLPVDLQYCRFSPYHDRPGDFDLRLKPMAIYDGVYPLPKNDIGELVYYFEAERDVEAEAPASLKALFAAIADWRAAWQHPRQPPLCCLVERGGERIILDTRAMASYPIYRPSDLAITILQAADVGISTLKLTEELGSAGYDVAMLTSEVADLIARGLLLEIDSRLVSIVLDAPVLNMPTPEHYPGGHVSDPVTPHAYLH